MNLKHYSFYAIVLMLIPILSYAFLVVHFSVNIPIWDDYDSVLSFLISHPSDTVQLFAQHNEHRIAWTRLVVRAYYALFGEINFRHLIYAGNTALFFIWFMLFKIFREKNLPAICFIPVTYLVFQPQSWENMTWAMAALQNYYSLLWALLTLYFWARRTIWGYCVSGFLGTVATYTSGNGLSIFLVLFIWEVTNIFHTLTSSEMKHKKHTATHYLQLPVLLVVTTCLCYLYFGKYQKPPHHPSISMTLSQPLLLIQYIGVLLGSYMEYMGKTVAFWIGMCEIIIFLFLTYKRYDRKNPVIYYFLLFTFLSIMMAGIGRAGFGVDQALSSRYRILASIALILIYWAFIESYSKLFLSKKFIMCCAILLAMGFNVGSTKIAIRSLTWRKDMLINGITEWKQNGKGLNYPNQERASLLLKQSIEKGIYCLSDL